MTTLDEILDDTQEFNTKGRHRTIKTEVSIIHVVCEDPYGLWRFYIEKGQIPRKYADQRWTSFQDCMAAIRFYMEDNKLTVITESDNEDLTPIDKTSVLPVIQYKKPKAAPVN